MLDKDRKTNEVKAHCQGGSVGGSPPNQSRKQPLFSPPTQQQQQPCTMDALFYHGPWSKEWGEASAGQPRFTEQAEIQRGRMMVRRQRERKKVGKPYIPCGVKVIYDIEKTPEQIFL